MKPSPVLILALGSAMAGSCLAQTATPAPADPAPVTGAATRVDAQGNPHTVTSHLPSPAERDHRAGFDAIDTDRDGNVDRREAASDKYLLRAFRALDTDRSGRLDYDEMLAWLDD